MDAIRRILPLLLIAMVAIGVALTSPPAARPAAGRDRPNLVVIMTDDQTVAELRGMPLTRRLIARRGVRFSRSYVSYPVCCPSRATYLTGQYAHNHGVMGLYPPTGGYGRLRKANTLPVWLQSAGYHTAHIGKFLNGYGDQVVADIPPGWSEWHATVDYSTYNMWGYTINDNGVLHTYGRMFDESPRLYQTDVLARRAVRIIERHAGGAEPLFLSLNLLAPHHETHRIQRRTGWLVRPAPRHRNALHSQAPARDPSFNEADVSDKPAFLRRRPRLGRASIRRLNRETGARRAALLAVDDAVARVVAALRRRGVLDDTVILFTSDNGYMQGQHRVRSGKMLPYDPASRVPLLIRGPGIPSGRVSRELVANVDLAPTLLALAGSAPGLRVDGRSLLPFAHRPSRLTRRPILHEAGGRRYSSGPREQDELANAPRGLRRVLSYGAVRTRRWLFVHYRDGGVELYDLRRDPDELNSLHADPRYQRRLHALLHELRRLLHCHGRTCRRASRPMPRPSG